MNLDHQVLVDVLCKGRRRVRVKRRFCHIKVEGGLVGKRRGPQEWGQEGNEPQRRSKYTV